MNREQVLEVIRPLTGIQVRQAENPTVRLEAERVFVRPAQHAQLLECAPHGMTALLQRAVIPETLAKRLSPQTFALVATEALRGQHSLMIREGQVVDFTQPNQGRQVEPERVLTTIERAMPQVDFHRVLTLPSHTVQIETVGVQERPVRKGDLVRAGALVRFSPIGVTLPMVQSYALRLVCTNGATSLNVGHEFTFGGNGSNGGSGGLWEWLRDSLREAYGSLGQIVEQWKQMIRERIRAEERPYAVEGLLQSAGIRGEQASAVRTEALAHPPQTAYDLLNLVTWASTHVLEDPRAIVRAQRAAAHFGSEERHAHVCPVCRRAR